ncbi:heptaprenylglyceryl phosphate synthase [Virgibacillus sp. 179-BFC.A HS]|uniref:Heptaprenylglyceryl phosphate synthase n=1 Tax=Tigheibacillus jepli TaxID=3035914 RepID=A0ABU5CJT8_9BACI|nr:heptaprenylglyceryl phosphate synthase [Virgibacillus sp. 179-BFC.A HS]MDY0406633.1 heptaprenylglyceryl phosphate synthase [Virgibacillus sp. 179-BFC.A HS]
MTQLTDWKHVFKLDPDKEISDEALEKICESGTDAIIVGGTDHITLDGVLDLLSSIRRYSVPCYLEVTDAEVLTPGFDGYLIPMVLNSTDKQWILGQQHEAIKEYREVMNWDEIFMEGYCIMNPDCKAFKKTSCELPLDEDVLAYAYMAEHVFHLPVFYLEYSGTYGSAELAKKVKNELQNTHFIYGGGIQTAAQAKEMKEYADTIVVGNSVYTNLKEALKTVKAVKQ